MKYLIPIICLFVFVGCTKTPPNILQTDKGKVKGVYNTDKTVRIFKGIPYAAPPIGELRWAAPQPIEAWNDIKSCTQFSASPIQNKPEPFYCWTEEFIAQPEPLSEDCLYLNVWTSAKSETEKLPVFVWIYGGGLVSGSANCDIYDGEEMAKKGVVFVSINYRVGVLGFMAHPELSKTSGTNASGNYGFMDQIAALKWIKDNISAFGGNPNNVTIAGQSAGAFSVNALIASPLTDGLFHKAILQSGGLLSNRPKQTLAESEAIGIQFMEKSKAQSIEELRQIPADTLQKISNQFPYGSFGVTLDDYVLPKDLIGHFKNGKHQQIPILAGWVTGDGNLSGSSKITLADYKEQAKKTYGKNTKTFLNTFPAATDEEAQAMQTRLALFDFAVLTAHKLANFNARKTYLYHFNLVPPEKPNFPNYGAFHTSEVPYALHTLHKWNRTWRPMDQKIENIMSSYWTNFAKTGNPNSEELPEWKTYDKEMGNILTIEAEVKSRTGMMKKELDFLEKY